MAFGFTDPAHEMAELALWFKSFPPAANNITLFDRIAEVSGVEGAHPHFYELMSAMTLRVDRLRKIVVETQRQGMVSSKLSSQVVSATDHLANLLSPAVALTAWTNALSNNLIDSDITALLFFSNIIQHQYALRTVSEDQAIEIRSSITEKIVEVTDDEELEEWVKKLTCDGLIRLEWSLKHLLFFGHDEIIVQLVDLNSKISAIHDKEPEGQVKTKLWNVVVFIGSVATCFAAADTTWTAGKHYFNSISQAGFTNSDHQLSGPKNHPQHPHGHSSGHVPLHRSGS